MSIPCQKGVNRRIFLCDRIEIRIREVISNEFDITYPQDAHFRPNVTLKEYNIYDKSGGTFTDAQATVTAEELIIKMLKSKVAEAAKEEKIA